MPRQFKVPAGCSFPATLADFKLAKDGLKHKRKVIDEAAVMEAPYPELVNSWLANGVTESKPKKGARDGI
jgi:hypothetical protein